jgi:hypothetical protein
MLRSHLRPMAALLAAAGLAALALAAPAGAASYRITGKQIAIDENAGLFKLDGSLVGFWKVTGFDTLATTPLLQARGTEVFKGCLDRRRNGCDRRDPGGTLSLTFTYEALFASPDPASLVWGSCRHPIVSGTGSFAGARGVIAMVDTPVRGGVTTDYIGNLTLPSRHRAAHHRGRAKAAEAGVTAPCGSVG